MRVAMFLLAAVTLSAQQDGREAALDRVARAATAMVDGELCRRIETPRSLSFATKVDARDPWAASDNYDVDAGNFIRTKKTLMRLARLCDEPCDVNLWMPLETDANKVKVVIRNVHEMSQFWNWGALNQEMPPEMRVALTEGKRVTVRRRPGMISVLAPVFDSLGNAVAVAEVVSQAKLDLRENVK